MNRNATKKKISYLFLLIIFCIPLGIALFIAVSKIPTLFDYISYNAGNRNSGTYNQALLSHRLVKEDLRLFPDTNNQAIRAWGNVNDFLISSAKACSGITEPLHFLKCSNNVLGNKFYYEASDLTSQGWSHHASDCDLNVYLLYDAARQNGIDLNIVYFPWHALIAFRKKPDGPWVYWETTQNNNHGALAEMTDPLYIKTPDSFFNTPRSLSVAEEIYPLMIIPDIHDDNTAIREFRNLPAISVSTPYYKDIALYINNMSSPVDITTLTELMAERPTSVGVKYLAAKWYMAHGMNKKAVELLSGITPGKCALFCISSLSQADISYKPDYYIAVLLNFSGVDATLENVRLVYLTSVIIFVFFLPLIIFDRKKKSQMT